MVVVAGSRLAGARRPLKLEIYVVRDKQVEMTIAIIVEKAATGAPGAARARYSGLLRDISEGAVSIVVVENVVSPIADKEIVEAVIVVVPDTTTLAPAAVCQSRLLCYIAEGAIAIVVE